MKLIAWLVYIPLQIIWLPLSLAGVLWTAYKQIWRSRVLGLSQTAIEIINGRWTGHVFGLRRDEASYRLAAALPNTSVRGLALALFPLWMASKIAGEPILYPMLPEDAQSGIANMVFSRSRRFDQIINAYAPKIRQFVVLGAGLDTRAYGPLQEAGLAMFEVDKAATQQAKRRALEKAGIDSAHVAFIVADFSQPDWIAALRASSYDPALPTLFLWEGVTLYLSAEEVRETLRVVSENAAPGSVITLDVYAKKFLDFGKGKAMKASLEATGEGLRFGLDLSGDAMGAIEGFAKDHGVDLVAAYPLGATKTGGAYMAVLALGL